MHQTDCVACRTDNPSPTGCSTNLLGGLLGHRQAQQGSYPLLPDAGASYWRTSLHGRFVATQWGLTGLAQLIEEQHFTAEL